jgi:hypothetical protein
LCTAKYSFHIPSCDRSLASFTVSSAQIVIQCFHFQCAVSPRFLKVIQWLLTSSSSSSGHFYLSFYISFKNVFYKTVPTQEVTNSVSLPSFLPSVYCMKKIPFLLDCVSFLFFRTTSPNELLSPASKFKTFQAFSSNSDLLSAVTHFQHPTKP